MLRGDRAGPFILVGWCAALGWSLFVLVLIMIHYGRPEQDFGLWRYLGVQTRDFWLLSAKNSALMLLGLCSLCAVCGIIRARKINKMMHLAPLSLIALVFLCISFTLALVSS